MPTDTLLSIKISFSLVTTLCCHSKFLRILSMLWPCYAVTPAYGFNGHSVLCLFDGFYYLRLRVFPIFHLSYKLVQS